MGKIGKISVIPKDYSSGFPTMEKSLRDTGRSRAPGTVRMLFPYKELNGRYRTGLDEDAQYIRKMAKIDPQAAQIEKRRVKDLREKLEEETGVSLGATSNYYNFTAKGGIKVDPVKLVDGDNIFNLEDAWQCITYNWLRVHPGIASSLQAYERGEFPADTQYFVNDEDVESAIQYRKNKTANDAIIKFDSWSLEKRRKVARLLDLPATEDTREEVVYNMVNGFLKADRVPHGAHKGLEPIRVFSLYADLKDDVLYVKDLVEQAFKHQIYKERKGGRIYEGELEVFINKDELTAHLMDEENQADLLELEKKLKVKKFAEI
jgi:hypothetical protein